jgi:hypothetical protein
MMADLEHAVNGLLTVVYNTDPDNVGTRSRARKALEVDPHTTERTPHWGPVLATAWEYLDLYNEKNNRFTHEVRKLGYTFNIELGKAFVEEGVVLDPVESPESIENLAPMQAKAQAWLDEDLAPVREAHPHWARRRAELDYKVANPRCLNLSNSPESAELLSGFSEPGLDSGLDELSAKEEETRLEMQDTLNFDQYHKWLRSQNDGWSDRAKQLEARIESPACLRKETFRVSQNPD